jgi:RNA polymerase sigma-B factor
VAATAIAVTPSVPDAELATYAQTKARELRDALVLKHMPLASAVAARYAGVAGQREDLRQVACLGLIKAVERFDPTLNVPFEAYARTIIAGEVGHYMRDALPALRVPRWYSFLNRGLKAAEERLSAALQRMPTSAELAAHMNLTPQAVEEILRLRKTYARADAGGKEPGSEPVPAAIRSQRMVSFHLPVEDRIALERAFEKLADLERAVVHLFFYKDLTQTQIAQRLGSTQRRISRLLAKALGKLKADLS